MPTTPPLPVIDDARYRKMLRQVWNTICYDVQPERGRTVSAVVVREVTGDQLDNANDRQAASAFLELHFDEQDRLLELTFPKGKYECGAP